MLFNRDYNSGIAGIFIAILFSFIYISTSAQQEESAKKLLLLNKKSMTVSESDSAGANDFGKNNSGVIVLQTKNGILFKSHLRSYPEILIELQSRSGEIIYNSAKPVEKNTEYVISFENIASGEYLLRFEYDNRLVICNLQISS